MKAKNTKVLVEKVEYLQNTKVEKYFASRSQTALTKYI